MDIFGNTKEVVLIKTYQDLIAVGEDEEARMDFVIAVINDHKSSAKVRLAQIASDYYAGLNTTIMAYNKFVYNLWGQKVPDIWSPNHKISCHYYSYFVTQEALYLLGNGVSFSDQKTKERLGKDFDRQITRAAIAALNAGEAYVFMNNDHIEVFPIWDSVNKAYFAPLKDEENGYVRAGVRSWQLAGNKPLRCTLYEEDGYTDYIKRPGEEMTVLNEKRPYIQIVNQSDATGEYISDGDNYPGFPIVPLYNFQQRSELEGNQEAIDALDLMMSTLVNNVDVAEVIYWVIKNAGGMDDIDDQRFIERLKTMHVVHTEGEEEVDAHTVNVPFEASDAAINQLRGKLFDNFMALDVKNIASGAATATEIKAAYEPLNSKTDLFELEVTDCINGILSLVGIDDTPSYTRSVIVNKQEEIQSVLQAAEHLSDEYVTQKLLEILGDIDKVEDVMAQRISEDMSRYSPEPTEDEGDQNQTEQEV